jgi:hypothetical protein
MEWAVDGLIPRGSMEPVTPTKDDFAIEPPNRWLPWVGSGFAAIFVMGVSVALMQRMGLFQVTPTDAGTKWIAASLALLGSVFTASVTLIGVMLKYAIDDRATTVARVEANRSYKLATEEAFRSRVDIALRAVDLLGENNADASNAQMGGSLLALSTLGEHELAIALLSQLWPQGQVASSTAEVVLMAAFSHGTFKVQKNAATLLFSNPMLLSLDGNAHIWPFSDPTWPVDLPKRVRDILAETVAEWLLGTIGDGTGAAYTAAAILYAALDDSSEEVRTTAEWTLRPLIREWSGLTIQGYSGSSFTMEDLADKLEALETAEHIGSRAVQRAIRITDALRRIRNETLSAED